jgi:quercetin dioxygenase-like cupin family protein
MSEISTPAVHKKGWGFEKWIVNNEFYCGKILHFEKGKRCSFHFHKLKAETFYLENGLVLILHSFKDDISSAIETILNPGSSFHIPVGLRHQVVALKDSNLFEFSTQHFEEDSYRLIKGD